MRAFRIQYSIGLSALAMAAAPAFAGGFAPTGSTVAPVTPTIISPAAPVSEWTGFYAGGQLGWGELDLSADIDEALAPFPIGDILEEISLGFDGTAYGVHGGYQRDLGQYVVGAEASYVRTNIMLIDIEEPGGPGSIEAGVDSVLRVGARGGYDAGRVLPYLTGGYARANLSADLSELGGPDLEESYGGYFFGAGMDFAVNDQFTLGAEVLRHNFGIDEFDDFELPDGIDINADVTTFSVRASYRF